MLSGGSDVTVAVDCYETSKEELGFLGHMSTSC